MYYTILLHVHTFWHNQQIAKITELKLKRFCLLFVAMYHTLNFLNIFPHRMPVACLEVRIVVLWHYQYCTMPVAWLEAQLVAQGYYQHVRALPLAFLHHWPHLAKIQ